MERPSFDNTFWQTFWPELIAGLISSLFVGLLIGLAIWWLETVAYRRRLDRELATVMQQLRAALTRPSPLMLEGPEDGAPQGARPAIEVVRAAPVDLWIHELRGRRTLLRAVAAFRGDYDEFALCSGFLETTLRIAYRAYSLVNAIEVADVLFISYASGRLIGSDEKHVALFTGLTPPDAATVEAALIDITGEPGVASAIDDYEERRRALAQSVTSLKSSLAEFLRTEST